MRVQRALVWSVLLAGAAVAAWSQQTPPPQLPPVQGARSGQRPFLPMTPVDPSKLSDEEKKQLEEFFKNRLPEDATLEDVLRVLQEPVKLPKETIQRLDDGLAFPHKAVPWKMKIVKEEGDFVWLQHLPPEDPESYLHTLWVEREKQDRARVARLERVEQGGDLGYVLDMNEPIVPPPSVDSVSFTLVDSALPKKGRWQTSFAVADMNGDGITDLVLPPERLGAGYPLIFLGEGGGRFHPWQEVKWVANVPYDYGAMAAGDLDGDGDQDLVLAIHFKGQYVLWNEGNGQFVRGTRMPTPDPRVTSRAVTLADFDGDRRLDLAFEAEVAYDQTASAYLPSAATAWVVLNRGGDKFELVQEGLPRQVIGDLLSTTDVDGDQRPDLVLAAGKVGWRSLLWLNTATGWKESYGHGVLSSAAHYQVVADPKPRGEPRFYSAFQYFHPGGGDDRLRTGLISYHWRGDDGLSTQGKVLVLSDEGNNQYWRVAAGDLNQDGLTDLVAGRKGGGLEVFLQTQGGDFVQDRSPELAARGGVSCIRLVDLDGDGRDDIIASHTPRETAGLEGGVFVWLTKAAGA
jgi:hypothetical protein